MCAWSAQKSKHTMYESKCEWQWKSTSEKQFTWKIWPELHRMSGSQEEHHTETKSKSQKHSLKSPLSYLVLLYSVEYTVSFPCGLVLWITVNQNGVIKLLRNLKPPIASPAQGRIHVWSESVLPPPPFWQINPANSAILGYFGAILGLYQSPCPPPFWISAPLFYVSWIRPCCCYSTVPVIYQPRLCPIPVEECSDCTNLQEGKSLWCCQLSTYLNTFYASFVNTSSTAQSSNIFLTRIFSKIIYSH